MAGGEQIGGNADCTVFAGAVDGGDFKRSEGVINHSHFLKSKS